MISASELEKLKYPAGKFSASTIFNKEEVQKNIAELNILPDLLSDTISGLAEKELAYSYRPGGWNIKQMVHHVADSHLNFHVRLRLSLTENTPTVKPYNENTWANLADALDDNLEPSLLIIKGVHARAVNLLRTLEEKDFQREYFHPEHQKTFNLIWLLGLYAWHGRHHVEQIKTAVIHKF